jgi:hypothetical protein
MISGKINWLSDAKLMGWIQKLLVDAALEGNATYRLHTKSGVSTITADVQ